MNEFDRYFNIVVKDDFSLLFKEPLLYDHDFVDFSNLYPTENDLSKDGGRQWRYRFRKVDANQKTVLPEVSFYSQMQFNRDKRLTAWSFSPLFLQIAPPEFLEVSLRSLAGADIDEGKKQLKANNDLAGKISAELPQKATVLANLGEPLEIKQESDHELYIYHFLLDTPRIEKGYESNALNEIKLSFDNKDHRLYNMAGNFAGLKVSIDYRKFLKTAAAEKQ